MARQYIHRISQVSNLVNTSSKSIITPINYIRPTISTHRSLHSSQYTSKTVLNNTKENVGGNLSKNHNNNNNNNTTSTTTNNKNFYSTATAALRPTPSLALKHDSDTLVNDNEDGTNDTSPKTQAFNFFAYAAWHPKNRSSRRRKSDNQIPYWKQGKVGKVDAGEDAFFQTCTPTGLALGVADGVGGWADVGVDPALFSWTLMNNAAVAAKDSSPSADAHHILDIAFKQLRQSGKVKAGSSTACILNLCKQTGKMTTCNLGDSAFILIRDQKVVYESPSQQHYFNCPYQLTVVPESYPNRELYVTDLPKDADQKSFYLKDGDVILLGTDGFFDNMYSHETLALVNTSMAELHPDTDDDTIMSMVRGLAKTLTDTAKRLSLDPKRLSPWAKEAQHHGSQYRGGKEDDIVLIATLVRGINNEEQKQ
ncbi:phosphatase 2C-like domain-containing protein [Cunninghamella echinulata]|nr:phosphatase 2C-like domain-containing protein [Cunninghamella echinulata]